MEEKDLKIIVKGTQLHYEEIVHDGGAAVKLTVAEGRLVYTLISEVKESATYITDFLQSFQNMNEEIVLKEDCTKHILYITHNGDQRNFPAIISE